MAEAHNKITLDVIKRNGKKVDFDASKIALAIKKGFDDVIVTSDESGDSDSKYTSKDINKVYLGVLKTIEKNIKMRHALK